MRLEATVINCLCVIQEGQAPDQRRDQLGAALGRFTEEHLGAGAEISWLPVAAGNGFTAGEPSTASVISLTALAPLQQSQRETLLRQLVDLWTGETGCSVDDVVAVISDPA